MNMLCITGMSELDLSQIAHFLQEAGVAMPSASKRASDISITTWHNRVFGKRKSGNIQDLQPVIGKLWEQLASDIFVANLDAPLWGWQESRSTWLLDFWADFEPRILFVLVCTSPAYQLARAMESDTQHSINVQEVITAWQAYHQQLLRFYNRYPERCLLVDASIGLSHPQALVQKCAANWELPLTVDSLDPAKDVSQPSALACHLAKGFLENEREVASLWREIEAT